MRKISALDLGRFKVSQGQMSWCQSIAHGWFNIRHPLIPSSYRSLFLRILMRNYNDLELGLFKVIREPIESPWLFSSDLLWAQRRTSRYFRDILTGKSCDLDLGRFKINQDQRWWCQLMVHGWYRIQLPLNPSSYLSTFSKHLTRLLGLNLGGMLSFNTVEANPR